MPKKANPTTPKLPCNTPHALGKYLFPYIVMYTSKATVLCSASSVKCINQKDVMLLSAPFQRFLLLAVIHTLNPLVIVSKPAL